MAFWNRKPEPYDRTRVLNAAEKARSKGKWKAAVAEYQKVLAHDPADPHVNVRIAPMLLKLGRHDEAGKAFEAAARSYEEKGFADKAGAVWAQAVEHSPLDARLWTRLAESAWGRGLKADAVKALMQGAKGLIRRKAHREAAVGLLEKAVGYDPLHLEATIDLARALKRTGRKDQALRRLENLYANVTGDAKKQVRRAQFGVAPGFGTWWRWFRA